MVESSVPLLCPVNEHNAGYLKAKREMEKQLQGDKQLKQTIKSILDEHPSSNTVPAVPVPVLMGEELATTTIFNNPLSVPLVRTALSRSLACSLSSSESNIPRLPTPHRVWDARSRLHISPKRCRWRFLNM